MLILTQQHLERWQRSGRDLYLCEGDSWLMNKLMNGYDIAATLSEKIDLCSFAMAGDTAKHMSSDKNLDYIEYRLKWIHGGDKIKGFLLSAGGNDLFDNLSKILCKQPPYVSVFDFQGFLNDIVWYISRIYYKIRRCLPGVPVYIHTYDYPYPTGIPVIEPYVKAGPWIWNKMQNVGIQSEDEGFALMKTIVDSFYESISTIEGLNVIDLRNTLRPIKDWENEIHPNKEGFKKVTEKVYDAMVKGIHHEN